MEDKKIKPKSTKRCFSVRQKHMLEVANGRRNMPRVAVKQGLLEGVQYDNYVAFKGIPYAKPPIGALRFRAPEPPEPWTGVRDASNHGPVCPQYNERLERIEEGSEDCLYLNVYTRTLMFEKPLPVMVWIHGGGFYTGSGNSDFYGPEFFMEQDVILVTFNYRLEVLGFLCLDNEDVPGNAGLKDQVAALKWVKNNISYFGGDSNNVTIFGCSAGSASVSFHLISKMSEGLFDKAICQSGVCLNEWSYNLYARQRAFQLGKILGKETEDENELLKFLKNAPTLSLVNVKLPILMTTNIDLADSLVFIPVIEKSHLKLDKFIEEPPIDIVKRGGIAKVPLILGYTSGEGIEIARNLATYMPLLRMTGAVVPRELKFKFSSEELADADNRIRKFYYNEKDISMDLINEEVKLETYKLFAYNIIRFARYYLKQCSIPIYLYRFSAETERNFMKKYYKMENAEGVCHADDLYYLFNVTNQPIPLTDDSRDIINRFVKMWVDFANTGNLTATEVGEQWKPFSDEERHIYVIERTFNCLKHSEPDLGFWEEIYREVNLE